MGIIKSVLGKTPSWGDNCFFADNSVVIGDVVMGSNCSIWFGAVVRGDVHYIKIGNNVNIQDNATIHGTYKVSPTNIGNNVSIAHNAVVHGCCIKDNVLIGIGAIILDDVIIKSNSIVAAGAVVKKGTIIESGSLYAGIPAKMIKKVDANLLENEINRIANSYQSYAQWYKK